MPSSAKKSKSLRATQVLNDRVYLSILPELLPSITASVTPPQLYAQLTAAILNAAARASYTRKAPPPQIPCLNSQVVRASRKVKRLVKAHRRQQSACSMECLREATRKLQSLVKQAKLKLTARILATLKRDPRRFYTLLQRLRGSRKGPPPLRDPQGNLQPNAIIKAQLLAHTFSEVDKTSSSTKTTNHVSPRPISSPLTTALTTPEEVLHHLSNLRDTSAGPDSVSPRMLRVAAPHLAALIADFHNTSIHTGYVPPQWKTAHVTPIPKDDDPTSPSNYRPISLNAVLSKVSETFVKNALLGHIIANNLISHSQHGALPHKSVVTTLLSMLDLVTTYLDESTPCDLIYFDLRKAFDTVPHSLLLKKLAAWGVEGPLLQWITNWLADRSQVVVVDGAKSHPYSASSAVLQGSVLGPLLFLIFMEDVDLALSHLTPKFLDDLKLVAPLHSEFSPALVQADIDSALQWAEENGMQWGVDKWRVLYLGTANPHHTYTARNHIIPAEKNHRDLGVTISSDLTFKHHIAKTIAKAHNSLFSIHRTHWSRDIHSS
eukprot:GHVN01063273.1.p1 GENE.GHVN01063273.1~~GHVN01063273.1.p1  ORF type:complete len:548 (-),score=83.86 GHVN01063273.1:652-2295(-)